MVYYYLVASLPTLALEGLPPFARQSFLEMCAGQLTAGDLADLNHVLAGRPEKARHPFVRRWLDSNAQILEVIVRRRAAARGVDPAPYLRALARMNLYLQHAAAEALSKPNPLDRELALDRLRWKLLEDLVVQDPFGMSTVLAYALKLMLAERWTALTPGKGRGVVDAMVESQTVEAVA